MTAPLQARVNALEQTTRTHKRELDTLREVDNALLGVVQRAVDKVEVVNQGFVKFGADVARRFEQIDARLDQVETSTNARFDRVDARFDRVDARFEQVDARFEQVDARFEQVDTRFQQMDARLDGFEKRVETRFNVVDYLLQDIRDRLPPPAKSAG